MKGLPSELYCNGCTHLFKSCDMKFYTVRSIFNTPRKLAYCHTCYKKYVIKCDACKKLKLYNGIYTTTYNKKEKKYLGNRGRVRLSEDVIERKICTECFSKVLWCCHNCGNHFPNDVESFKNVWKETHRFHGVRQVEEVSSGPYCKDCFAKCKRGAIMIRPRMANVKFVEETREVLTKKEDNICVESQGSSHSVVSDQVR